MERETEAELARRMIAGEPEAFDRFVEYFRTKIFNYSWLMCGHREDAEEVAQETLLTVFESFDKLREPERVRPWIFRIAKNACLMKRRKSIYAPARELSLDELMLMKNDSHAKLQIADWSLPPDEQIQRAEVEAVLEHAITELPEMYKSVILLRDMEELSTQETAQILDVSVDSVKTRLHRARLAVRKKLDAHFQAHDPAGTAGVSRGG